MRAIGRFLFAAGLMLASAAAAVQPATARNIRVNQIDASLMDQIYRGTPRQAFAGVADYTVLINVLEMPAPARQILDISGKAVVYFFRDGRLAGWSDKSNTIVGGTWQIVRQDGLNNVCIYFPRGGGKGVCATALSNDSTWIKESTQGNVFDLQVGQPVPFAFPSNAGLATIAQRFD